VQQVRSLPDGVARALELHMELLQGQQVESVPQANNGHSNGQEAQNSDAVNPLQLSTLPVTGNLCPECGCNTMVYEEGCRKCYTCGHSEC
jgi:ribonucleoside-diphosphate reductase alpha chain